MVGCRERERDYWPAVERMDGEGFCIRVGWWEEGGIEDKRGIIVMKGVLIK